MSYNNAEMLLIFLGAVVLVGSAFWEKKEAQFITDWHAFLNLPWSRIGFIFLLFIIAITVFVLIIKHRRRLSKERKEQEEEKEYLKKRFKEITEVDFGYLDFSKFKENVGEIEKKLVEEGFRRDEDFEDYLEEFDNEVLYVWQEKEQREKKLIREYWDKKEQKKQAEEEKKRIFFENVDKLFDFKKKKKSVAAMPLKHNFSSDVIYEAENQMRRYVEEQDDRKEARQRAIEYYEKHSLDSEPNHWNDIQREEFAKVRGEIANGTLSVKKKEEVEYKGKKFDKVFYRVKELDEEQRIRAAAQGFQYVRLNELDGHVSGGFYIKKENPRESAFHFCMKHLFKELHGNMNIEYRIEDRRADLALLLPDYKIGIEIESGANRLSYLDEKIPILNKHFDHWLLVCRKKDLTKYKKLVDHKKSLCMTPKMAKEYIIDFIAPLEAHCANGENA
ncbi:hypothetical protein ACFL3V_03675 [Nanoarchaeota archaeon]